MNFTREPIIETIITPRDGYKIVVRNTKAANAEEYFVDAVEVVSFGNAFFFRSLERPKCFLVPVSDFEICEVKESRMVLKNVGVERVKIGGGRETMIKATKEGAEKEEPKKKKPEQVEAEPERKKEKKRSRRKRVSEERKELAGEKTENTEAPPKTKLIPPPSSLISETIARYQTAQQEKSPTETALEAKEAELEEEKPRKNKNSRKKSPKPKIEEPKEEKPVEAQSEEKPPEATGEVTTLERSSAQGYSDSDYLTSLVPGIMQDDTQLY